MPKTFPIQRDQRHRTDGTFKEIPAIQIPWSVAEVAFAAYQKRYPGQSLERLAERHGFGRDEFLNLLALAVVDQRDAEQIEMRRLGSDLGGPKT